MSNRLFSAQTQPIMQDYPSMYHHYWTKDTNQNLPHVEIAVENVHMAKGSCCNNGDIEVASCGGGWWYQCKDWGLRNLTTWLKFGEYGFTMPPATEHKATCEYSSERVLCPQPRECKTRYPKPRKGHDVLNREDVCKEIVNTVLLGPVKEQQEAAEKEKRMKADLKAKAKELAFQRAVVEQLDEALEIDTQLMEKSDALWQQRLKALKESGQLDKQELEEEVEEVQEGEEAPTKKKGTSASAGATATSKKTSSESVSTAAAAAPALPLVVSRTYGKDRPKLNPAGDTDINGDAADREERVEKTVMKEAAMVDNTDNTADNAVDKAGEGNEADAEAADAAPRVVGGSRKGGRKGGKGKRRKKKAAAARLEAGETEGVEPEGGGEQEQEGGESRQRTRQRGAGRAKKRAGGGRGGRGGGRSSGGDGESVAPKLDDIQ